MLDVLQELSTKVLLYFFFCKLPSSGPKEDPDPNLKTFTAKNKNKFPLTHFSPVLHFI